MHIASSQICMCRFLKERQGIREVFLCSTVLVWHLCCVLSHNLCLSLFQCVVRLVFVYSCTPLSMHLHYSLSLSLLSPSSPILSIGCLSSLVDCARAVRTSSLEPQISDRPLRRFVILSSSPSMASTFVLSFQRTAVGLTYHCQSVFTRCLWSSRM